MLFTRRSSLIFAISILLVAAGVGCRVIGFHATRVPNAAMEPAIKKGEVLFWWNIKETERAELKPGLIVAFKAPDDLTKIRIKRIVAMGGDRIQLRGNTLYVNDEPVQRPYGRNAGAVLSKDIGPTEVPEGTVYVIGDNWDNSIDSRQLGPIPIGSILGEIHHKE